MDEFPSFLVFSSPTFPPEIQDLIWQHSVDNAPPRMVELRYTPPKTTSYSNTLLYTSTSPIPALLHVCSRSRAIALKRWRLSFAYQTEAPKIFFDFQHDTLFFGFAFPNMSLFLADDKKEVRKVALSLRAQRYAITGNRHLGSVYLVAKMLFTDFPALEYIGLMVGDRDKASGSAGLIETIVSAGDHNRWQRSELIDAGIIKHYFELKGHPLEMNHFEIRSDRIE